MAATRAAVEAKEVDSRVYAATGLRDNMRIGAVSGPPER